MLSDLIRCAQAMPQQHYSSLDETLESMAARSGLPTDSPACMAVFSSRLVLASSRSEDLPQALEATLEQLARLTVGYWQPLRTLLLDMRQEYLDMTQPVIPIAAWLSELVTEVDGRRLDNELESARSGNGGNG